MRRREFLQRILGRYVDFKCQSQQIWQRLAEWFVNLRRVFLTLSSCYYSFCNRIETRWRVIIISRLALFGDVDLATYISVIET